MEKICFSVYNDIIVTSDYIKVLGVTFDDKLNFHRHINNLCRNCSRQVNAFRRISMFLNERNRLAIFNAVLRIKCLAVEMYRCGRVLNPEYLNDMYAIKEREYALRDCSRIQQSKFKTYTFGYKSFQYYGAKVWNSIPIHVKNSTDLSIFKQDVDLWCRSHEANTLSIC